MLQAQLKGKLSVPQENSEDILTSNVFGTLKYLPINEGLLPFLYMAVSLEGIPFEDCIKDVSTASFRFWEGIRMPGCQGCEPDVLIEFIHVDGTKSLVLIEAKYRSGKSSEANEETIEEAPPHDQLAKEWHNLLNLSQEKNSKPYLVYVTADYAIPRKEIIDSFNELQQKELGTPEIYWLTWRDLKRAYKNTSNPILADLVELITNRYQLTTFESLTLGKLTSFPWSFKVIPLQLSWQPRLSLCPWKILSVNEQSFVWQRFMDIKMYWRFEQ